MEGWADGKIETTLVWRKKIIQLKEQLVSKDYTVEVWKRINKKIDKILRNIRVEPRKIVKFGMERVLIK